MKRPPALPSAAQQLAAVPYFAGLDQATLDWLASQSMSRRYEAGQVVLLEGEPCVGLSIIKNGWLKVSKIGLDGREQVLQILQPGETFNMISVFTDAPNQATVTALEPAQVWTTPREVLLRLLDEQPGFARQVIADLAGRVMHLVRMVEDLSLLSVEARLARLLLHQAEGASVRRRRWATQAEIANRLGTVPDVVNRALRKLETAGVIQVERQQIRLLDVEKLRQAAQIPD